MARVHATAARAFACCSVALRSGQRHAFAQRCRQLARRITVRRTARGWVVQISGGRKAPAGAPRANGPAPSERTGPGAGELLGRDALPHGGLRWTVMPHLRKWELPAEMHRRFHF